MNSFYAFDVKDNLLSATIWLTRAMQAEFALPGVKTEEAVCRKRLLFVREKSNNIPIECGNSSHIFDKEYDATYVHTVFPNPAM